MVKIFVEGGGDSRARQTGCRKGFRSFLESAGQLSRGQYQIVACGSRDEALKSFSLSVAMNEIALLLVDSEGAVDELFQGGDPSLWQPWEHLRQRDGVSWSCPAKATDNDCHLMVECMENWLLADPENVQAFFGQGFIHGRLPSLWRPLESISKSDAFACLAGASEKSLAKGGYNKGRHSFELLSSTRAALVLERSPWAKRFVRRVAAKIEISAGW